MGDNSCGGSWARTHATVAEAPRETVAPTPTQTANTPCELYTIGSADAIIITIAIAKEGAERAQLHLTSTCSCIFLFSLNSQKPQQTLSELF